LIRAKLEANRDILADIGSDDYAKKMVKLINEKKRLIREQRERDRMNNPMSKGEQREYMMNYLKSCHTPKIPEWQRNGIPGGDCHSITNKDILNDLKCRLEKYIV
jgi:hypothetical protein